MKVSSSGGGQPATATVPVESARYSRTAALSIANGAETALLWDTSAGSVTGMGLAAGEVLWTGGTTILHGHVSLTYQGVAALSSMRIRLYVVRGGTATPLEDQVFTAGLATLGAASLPDMSVEAPVQNGDKLRVTITPTTLALPVPLVLGSAQTHLDLHQGGAG